MSERRHAQRRVAHAPHTPDRRTTERRACIGCGRPASGATTSWCSPGCRTKWLCDHPTIRLTLGPASREAALVAVVEARFQVAKLAIRRASRHRVDGWAQRPGGGRGMEDWGSEE